MSTADAGILATTFVGDTMLGDAAQSTLDTLGYDRVFEQVRSLVGGDFTIANAEAPITSRPDPFVDQTYSYNMQPASAQAIRGAGIDALSLANNHAMDRGPEGLADTIATAGAAELATVGAGDSACRAELPLLIHSPSGTLAIIALANYQGPDKTAQTLGAGTIGLSRASIERGASLARASGADWIVGFVHWGENYKPTNDAQRTFAEYFAASGYDLVIGTHPHITQEIEFVQGMPVLYSIGNFAFGSAGQYTDGIPGVGLIVQAGFGGDGLRSLRLQCIVTDNEIVQFQPRPCDQTLASTVLGGLNPEVRVVGNAGYLAVP
ncbi:MAG: CapA family protein [Propionibacteriaceae bacterium]|nr:CapA family protein [Propionibacteriaceae bacterium]